MIDYLAYLTLEILVLGTFVLVNLGLSSNFVEMANCLETANFHQIQLVVTLLILRIYILNYKFKFST